jgi:hypothetical protein
VCVCFLLFLWIHSLLLYCIVHSIVLYSFVLERKDLDTRGRASTALSQDSCVKEETLPMAMVREASPFTDAPLTMKTLTLRTVEQVCNVM